MVYIYPLNRNAVKPIDITSEKYCGKQQGTNQRNEATERYDANEEHSTTNKPEEESDYSISFTPEQEDLFKKIFDEGYDLCIDPEHNAWLKINHPESLMDSAVQ